LIKKHLGDTFDALSKSSYKPHTITDYDKFFRDVKICLIGDHFTKPWDEMILLFIDISNYEALPSRTLMK
jgi:hypothetical protein